MSTLRAQSPASALLGAIGAFAVLAAAIGLLVPLLAEAAAASVPVVRAVWLGLAASVATAGGALTALALRRVALPLADGMLGFGAGVMLAATSFSLVLPALEAAGALGATP
ncbi:MAG TPA: ZIP family metal transporter, partial [Burkholderiaceae bacterium]|nr:ZIP family metal transporter [Burkholderiaceae bacterium]